MNKTIKIKVKEGSKLAAILLKMEKDSNEFHEAVRNGTVKEYAKNRKIKFATPIK